MILRVLLPATTLALGFLLAGCVSAPVPPVVDMAGVDPVRLNQDLAACEEERRNTFFSVGPPLANCMRAKGYKVLIGPN